MGNLGGQSTIPNPPGQWTPPPALGVRPTGELKHEGWRGRIWLQDGKSFMTEDTVGVRINGKETEIPLITPLMTDDEVRELVKRGGKPTDAMVEKAATWARQRMSEGKSPFYDGDPADEKHRNIYKGE